jgi:predicted GH43/DUF377 family glycosyl hydrolase
MQIHFYKMLMLITVLMLSNAGLFAQVTWTKYPGNPVLTGQPGTWYAYVTMNSVLYNADSSRYEMWFTAGTQIGYPYAIGFAWSADGISWNVYSPNPVLTPTSGSWDAYTVLAPYVLRENGQYKMWYSGCQTDALTQRIGYATSSDGINWTKHASNPVLEPGSEPWESAAVAYPCIMPYSNGYKMWYGGYSADMSVTAIGNAVSPDGINWERYTANPVLPPGASGQWDHVVFGPRVLEIDNIYYMFYTGETVVYVADKIGLAVSSDGLVWTKSGIVLQPTSGQWDGNRTNLGSVVIENDTLKMYYCGLANSNMKLGLATSLYTSPLLPGTYTVGAGGSFATIQEALNKLETNGVAGNVTLELIDDLYTAPTDSFGFRLNGPIPGAGPDRRVIIKPAENKNVVLEGNGFRVMCLINTSYVTIDGAGLSGPTTLTFHALHNSSFSWNDCLVLLYDSDHNIVQNITFTNEDYYRAGISVWLNSNTSAAPDNNLMYNNFVKKGTAMYLNAPAAGGIRPDGNIIRGNFIGSETDSLISWGIQVERCKNTIVENNHIQNIKVMNTITDQVILGINSFFGSGDIIRNNVVHNLKASSGWSAVGILISGISGQNGSNCIVYNNMVYDIQSSSTNSDSRVSGIQIFNHSNPKVYYNTVYLSGTGTNRLGSAALYIYNNATNADIRNNIFVNTRDEGQYCASAIYDYTSGNLVSDYNDFYYDNTDNNNCLVRIANTDYYTMADWHATGKDMHSIIEMPNFIVPHLHISASVPTYLEGRATKILGYGSDIDGDVRHITNPDIGADEFSGIAIVGVEEDTEIPTEFALGQNYPNPFNPGTKISWQVPIGSHQTIKVFDVLGNEIVTLVDEYKPAGRYEVELTAASMPSGVYFYQLKAGNLISTKKMLLVK